MVEETFPEGSISCLDCVTTKEEDATCVMGSTDNSVKFVKLRYGHVNQVRFAAF